jgi:hypothetical protein
MVGKVASPFCPRLCGVRRSFRENQSPIVRLFWSGHAAEPATRTFQTNQRIPAITATNAPQTVTGGRPCPQST